MRLHRRLRTAAVLLALLYAAVPAPVWAADAPRTLVYAGGSDITTLDGGFVIDIPAQSILKHIFNTLVRVGPDSTIEPDLAQSWTVAADRVTWTFKLRPSMRFSNGTPVTARAVKGSIERLLDPATAAPNRSVLAQVASVDAVNDQTVRIVTRQPFPDLLRALADRASVVMDPTEAAKYPPREVGRHPVGSGPYRVATWTAGQQIVLERNPHWSGAVPEMERIVYRVVPEGNTRLAMVRRQEADIIARPPLEALSELERDPDLRVIKLDGIQTITLELLTDKKPLADVRVRRAMAHAIDRRALIDGLLRGLAGEHCSTVTPGVGREFLAPQPCYEYSPVKARELLAQAGLTGGFDLDFWTPNGRYTKDREVGEAIQAMLGDVGIRARLQTFEWATYLQKWTAPDRMMWMIGRSAGFTDFIFTRHFSRTMWDSGANNNTRFTDPQVESLLVTARQEMDPKRRAGYYRQIQEITWQALPIIPLYTEKIVVVTRSNIAGLTVMPDEEFRLAGVTRSRGR